MEERKAFEKVIRNSGYYFYYTTYEELNETRADPKKMDALFSKLMCESLENWVKTAEERLKGENVKCFLSPGNDDRYEIDPILKKSSLIIDCEEKVCYVDENHEMITLGSVNPTPFHCPRDISEDELGKKLEIMISSVKNMKNCIFNTHVPPYNSTIDTAPNVDTTLKVVAKGGQIQYIPAGSTAVRKAIETYQPLLGLHGHIHESRGEQKIGRTLCINPGSEYSQGVLRGVLVDLQNGKIEGHYLTSG
jgi:Icc-related predicted phosphoesterase